MNDSDGTAVQRGNPATARNALIRSAWQVGLDNLKPTDAQLEHGLALHRDSMVIDTFAFLPMLWNDETTRRWDALIEAGVSGNEFSFRSGLMRSLAPTYDAESARDFLEALWCTGLTGVIQTVGEGKTREEDIKRMAASAHLCGWFADHVRPLRRPGDLRRSHADGIISIGSSVNGPPCTSHLYDLDDETRWLETWHQFGVRMMHLSYNRRNAIATGCAERHDGGLSELGYEFVREMNRVGLIVDLAHSSDNTCIHAAEASGKPIVASHTGCKAVFDHMRNKSDRALKAIADTDGVVGVVARPSILGPDASIHTLLDHIDHVVKLLGVDHVAIGTDTTVVATVDKQRRKPIASAYTTRWWGAWWNQQTHNATTSEAHRYGSLAWTNWPLLTVGLAMRGYEDDAIRKILGENFLRVLEANQPDSHASAAASPDETAEQEVVPTSAHTQ